MEDAPLPPSELAKKGMLIGAMLDEIHPITDEMPLDKQVAVDVQRQVLVMKTGWESMSVPELEQVYRGNVSRPFPY